MNDYDYYEWPKQSVDGELECFLARLTTGELTSAPLLTDHSAGVIAFTDVEGQTFEVDGTTWLDVLDAEAPCWMRSGICVQSQQGRPVRLLWEVDDRFFVRRLTAEESSEFARLNTSKPS